MNHKSSQGFSHTQRDALMPANLRGRDSKGQLDGLNWSVSSSVLRQIWMLAVLDRGWMFIMIAFHFLKVTTSDG